MNTRVYADSNKTSEQIPTPCLEGHSQCREAVIRKVSNGFIVVIGCKTFVAKTWAEVNSGLAEYWQDPIAAEKKFCK